MLLGLISVDPARRVPVPSFGARGARRCLRFRVAARAS